METIVRLSIALGVISIMLGLEIFIPRRQLIYPRKQRWPTNISLAILNITVVRFSVGSLAYVSALQAQEMQWGLFNYFALPHILAFALSLILLDLAIYFQHILAHRWPLLWRLHQVHHTDLEFDATTAVRFHPLEILLSLFYKVGWILLLGASPLAVLIFEILLNACTTFNHSNVQISQAIEQKLRLILVTPDMHRIHHSVECTELNSNYGFSISCWDRLFRTYTAQPKSSHTEMPIGLKTFRNLKQLTLLKLLRLPFTRIKQ